MKDLIAKIGRFCENHVEKIVLGLAILISVWLFFTRVAFSPNMVAIRDKSFSPGKIDRHIYEGRRRNSAWRWRGTRAAAPSRTPRD